MWWRYREDLGAAAQRDHLETQPCELRLAHRLRRALAHTRRRLLRSGRSGLGLGLVRVRVRVRVKRVRVRVRVRVKVRVRDRDRVS